MSYLCYKYYISLIVVYSIKINMKNVWEIMLVVLYLYDLFGFIKLKKVIMLKLNLWLMFCNEKNLIDFGVYLV